MPLEINGKLIPTRDEWLRESQAQKLSRKDYVDGLIARDRAEFGARREQALAQHPIAGKIGSLLSAALNYGETMGFGAPSTAAAGLTAPITAATQGLGLREAYDINKARAKDVLGASPTAKTVGTVAGYLNPRGLPAGVARAGFRAGGGRILAGGAARLAETGWAKSAAATQLLSALTGGAGSITAVNLSEGAFDDRSLSQVVRDNVDRVFSVENAVLSGGAGGMAALARTNAPRATVNLLNRAKELIPGFQPSAADYREPGGFIHNLVDSLAKSNKGRATAAKFLKEQFYIPMERSIRRIESAFPDKERSLKTTGKVLNEILDPTNEDSLKQQIVKMGEDAVAPFSQNTVSRGDLVGIAKTIHGLDRTARRMREASGKRGGEVFSLLSDAKSVLLRAAKQTRGRAQSNVTIEMLDELRKRAGEIADFGSHMGAGGVNLIRGRDVKEARELYHVLSQTIRAQNPSIENAYNDISHLRGLWNDLKQVVNVSQTGDEIQIAKQIFTAQNFEARWNALQELLPREKIQAIRGAYLAQFLEESKLVRGTAGNAKRILNEGRVFANMEKPGSMFRRTVFDSVLPGVREEIEVMSRVSGMMMRNLGRAEGSRTARALEDLEDIQQVADIARDAVELMKSPTAGWRLAGRILGPVGSYTFANSLLNGRIRGVLIRSATGVPINAGQRAPATVMSLGGLSGLAQMATGGGRSIGNSLGVPESER